MIVTLVIGIIAVLVLAYANGANDIANTVATIVGGRVSNYRKALLLGACFTVLGGLFSYLFATGLLKAFSALIDPANVTDQFAISVIIGAVLWVIVATRFGMPVSTTHSITGSIVGLGLFVLGMEGVKAGMITKKIVLPLLISPVIAIILAFVIFWITRHQLHNRFAKFVDKAHWITAMFTSLARGLNDGPKIVALVVICFVTKGVAIDQPFSPVYWMFIGVAIMMGLGSLISGRRVTKTMGFKITPMQHADGFVANLVTSVLITTGAWHGLPMSTTHVSNGAIIGVGLKDGKKINWKTVGEMALAWIVTAPVSAGLAIATYWTVGFVL